MMTPSRNEIGATVVSPFRCQICGDVASTEEAYSVNGFEVRRCPRCGVGSVSIENFDPDSLYTEEYFCGGHKESYVDYFGSKSTLDYEFAQTVDFVRAVGPSKGALLEIGCAYGFFLKQAQNYYDVHGIEVVRGAVEYCRSQGLLNVQHGVFDLEARLKVGEVDVCVMLDVIEHIANVEETVALVSEALRPGGSFIVTTGDWSSLVARLLGPRWRLMAPPYHLWYFTPDSLVRLANRYGLELVSSGHPWKRVPLELIIKQAFLMAGRDVNLTLPFVLKNAWLPANLGDAMRLAFRKR